MIVDEETLDLSNSIERLLADLSEVPTEGEVKPELMEGVCEIATTPVRNTVEAGDSAALAAADRATRWRSRTASRSARRARTRSRSGRTSGSWRGRATAT